MLEPTCASVRLVPHPKRGGVRWLTYLDPTAAASYARSVAPLVPAIEAALPPHVVANRVRCISARPPAIVLESWVSARRRFRSLARQLALGSGAALLADVRDCYGSISPDAVLRALEAIGCPRVAARRAVEVVRGLSDQGVRGLPVGPEPSAVLANAVLLRVDRELAAAGLTHVRWVDDVVVFARDAARARRALDVLASALEPIGLALAAEKTRLLDDPSRRAPVDGASVSPLDPRPGPARE